MKMKKSMKIGCFVILLLLGSMLVGYCSLDNALTVQVTYGPEGTTQTSGIIEYGNAEGDITHSQTAKINEFSTRYRINYNSNRYDMLQIGLGDYGGTIYIDKICISYHNKSLCIKKNQIEKYFEVSGAETVEKGEKYLEFFTYDAHYTKLVANDKMLAWLTEANEQDNVDVGIVDNLVLYYEIIILFVLFWLARQDYAPMLFAEHKRLSYSILFIMTFAIYFIRLLVRDSMIDGSGDAYSIWQTITTYYSDHIESSYVLYKGMFSVYPYVWLYRLSCIFGVNEFLFVKLYNAILFAYVAAFGMPSIFEKIFEKEITPERRWLFTILVFNLQVASKAYFSISVDLPSMFWFVLLMDIGVHIWKGKKEKYIILECFGVGIAAGATLCFSGQYLLAGIAAIAFVFVVVAQKKKIKQTILGIAVIVICVLGIKSVNNIFVAQIIEPMREMGEWLPDGEEWLVSALRNEKPFIGSGYASVGDFQDTQAIQIIAEEKPEYTWNATFGEVAIEYFRVMLKHPIKFLVSCGNKLFLAFCMDAGGKYSFLSLGMGFALFFGGMFVIVQRYLGEKCVCTDKIEYLVSLAFFLSILVPCAFHMELRYAITIQNFIFGFGIFGMNTECMADGGEKESSNGVLLLNKKNLAVWLGGALFVIFCIMHYAALLD